VQAEQKEPKFLKIGFFFAGGYDDHRWSHTGKVAKRCVLARDGPQSLPFACHRPPSRRPPPAIMEHAPQARGIGTGAVDGGEKTANRWFRFGKLAEMAHSHLSSIGAVHCFSQ